MTAPRSPVAVSAPGKVLFAGGFLVLDRAHTGLVFSLNARIHVHVRPWITTPGPVDDNDDDGYLDEDDKAALRRRASHRTRVRVSSPQFRDATWDYDVTEPYAAGEAVSVMQTNLENDGDPGRNHFVGTSVLFAFTYLSHVLKEGLFGGAVCVTIFADEDYYSASTGAVPGEDKGEEQGFRDFGVRLSEAHKTGLGSSAALTTALVGALVTFYGGKEMGERREVVHNLAQAAHCDAQGKVGSGFDVAAAVYGSCLYRRFSPSVVELVGEPSTAGFGERLHRCVEDLGEQKWDVEILADRVKVPEGLLLVLCDVDCGSATPGMVRKMLAWRKEKPEEAGVLWASLQMGQEELCEELGRLSALPVEVVNDQTLTKLTDTIQTTRSLVREMSAKSEVPVEPEVITQLLDSASAVDGVLGGVAPGAGGYDAVALLVRNDSKVVAELQARLQGWKSQKGGAEIGNVRLLGVKQGKGGMRREDANNQRYKQWWERQGQ